MAISIANIIVAFGLSLVSCYFVRSDMLVDSNSLRTLPTPLLIQCLQLGFRLGSIVFRALVEVSEFRLGFLICDQVLQVWHDIKNIGA